MGFREHNQDRNEIFLLCSQHGWGTDERDYLVQRAVDKARGWDRLVAGGGFDREERFGKVTFEWCVERLREMNDGPTFW